MTVTRRALVTGANGFVGRWLCARLREDGTTVRAVLRAPCDGPWDEAVYGELGGMSPPSHWFERIDTIYHAAGIAHSAAQGTSSREVYWRVNVHGSVSLAEAAVAAGVGRLIYWSSVQAMGSPGEDCVNEDWPALPTEVYGASKREAEHALLAVAENTGLHVSILRPALVYGPGVKGNLLRMMEQIDRGKFPPLPETCNRRSMVHVDDLVEAAILIARQPAAKGRVYIVTDGQVYSTREIYDWFSCALKGRVPKWRVPKTVFLLAAKAGDLFQSVVGKSAPINTTVVEKLLGSACYNSRRISDELGFRPRWTFGEAVQAMVDAYRIADAAA